MFSAHWTIILILHPFFYTFQMKYMLFATIQLSYQLRILRIKVNHTYCAWLYAFVYLRIVFSWFLTQELTYYWKFMVYTVCSIPLYVSHQKITESSSSSRDNCTNKHTWEDQAENTPAEERKKSEEGHWLYNSCTCFYIFYLNVFYIFFLLTYQYYTPDGEGLHKGLVYEHYVLMPSQFLNMINITRFPQSKYHLNRKQRYRNNRPQLQIITKIHQNRLIS